MILVSSFVLDVDFTSYDSCLLSLFDASLYRMGSGGVEKKAWPISN